MIKNKHNDDNDNNDPSKYTASNCVGRHRAPSFFLLSFPAAFFFLYDVYQYKTMHLKNVVGRAKIDSLNLQIGHLSSSESARQLGDTKELTLLGSNRRWGHLTGREIASKRRRGSLEERSREFLRGWLRVWLWCMVNGCCFWCKGMMLLIWGKWLEY